MRFIDKSKVQFPKKLNSTTTKTRRDELVLAIKLTNDSENVYISNEKYNSRYKTDDVKKQLKELYKNKCAFCETNIERWDVEHFRPKSLYPWLAYSWDNLLLACPTCNGYKNNHFAVLNSRVKFKEEDLANIHNLAKKYNESEDNLFINPELENDIHQKLIFDKTGKISSNDKKVQYTIETCKLDREDLNIERRKQVLNQYVIECQLRFSKYEKDKNKLKEAIQDLREAFKINSENLENNYTAFRKYALENFVI